MKHPITVLFLFILLTSFRPVGSNTAYLDCKSYSGRTSFTAEIQDIDGLLEKAELKVDGVSLTFSDEDTSSVVCDPANGVYTVILESNRASNHRFLKFWAIPKSFKILSESREDARYEFRAKVQATEPRKNKDLLTPVIELNCTLTYKI